MSWSIRAYFFFGVRGLPASDRFLRQRPSLVRLLSIPDPARIEGKAVVVYDDLCTTGYQLDRVARVLKAQGGAAVVNGLTLARVAWS